MFLRNSEQGGENTNERSKKKEISKKKQRETGKTRETKTCGAKKTKRREPRNVFGVFLNK